MRNMIPDVIFFAGSAVFAIGVGMIYLPAGVVAAGLLLILWSLLLAASQSKGDDSSC